MGEKEDAFVFSFLLQITRFIRNMASWDCKDRMLSEVLLGVSVLSRFQDKPPQQPRGDCD